MGGGDRRESTGSAGTPGTMAHYLLPLFSVIDAL